MEVDVIPRSGGTFIRVLSVICMCVPMCDISIVLYCYVSTLTPLYVRPPNDKPQPYIIYNHSPIPNTTIGTYTPTAKKPCQTAVAASRP